MQRKMIYPQKVTIVIKRWYYRLKLFLVFTCVLQIFYCIIFRKNRTI